MAPLFLERQECNSCPSPCDHLPRRSWPLFRARDLMRGVIESIQREQRSKCNEPSSSASTHDASDTGGNSLLWGALDGAGRALATVRKWRGREDMPDRSHRPNTLSATLTPAKEALLNLVIREAHFCIAGLRLRRARHSDAKLADADQFTDSAEAQTTARAAPVVMTPTTHRWIKRRSGNSYPGNLLPPVSSAAAVKARCNRQTGNSAAAYRRPVDLPGLSDCPRCRRRAPSCWCLRPDRFASAT